VDLLLVKNAQSEHLSNASSIAQYPTPLNSPTTNSQPERSQVFGRPEYDNTSHGIEWRSPADTSKQKRACSGENLKVFSFDFNFSRLFKS
jgi:hypothetical protein